MAFGSMRSLPDLGHRDAGDERTRSAGDSEGSPTSAAGGMISAYDDTETMCMTLERKADEFLTDPVDSACNTVTEFTATLPRRTFAN